MQHNHINNCTFFAASTTSSPVDVVLELVVAGQGDHAAPGDPEGEKDLDARVGPDLQHVGRPLVGGGGVSKAGFFKG